MDARNPSPQAYGRPTVADYGTLAELTADAGLLMPFGVAAVSSPLVPQPPGGPGPDVHASQVPNAPEGGTAGDVSGGGGGGGGGQSTPAGEQASGGGGGGGGFANPADTGSGGGGLPFTGFPAAVAAAVGAALAGGGAALRRKLSRKRP
jgi:hypothetical protein